MMGSEVNTHPYMINQGFPVHYLIYVYSLVMRRKCCQNNDIHNIGLILHDMLRSEAQLLIPGTKHCKCKDDSVYNELHTSL